MNTQELCTQLPTSSVCHESGNDSFAQCLLLWVASFPLFIAGLLIMDGALHTIGYILELAAAICFLSPVTLLLGCLTDRKSAH